MSDFAQRVLNGLRDSILRRAKLYGLFRATVLKSRGSNKFDIKVSSLLFPALENVQLWSSLPGMTLELEPNTEVLVGFLEGDLRLPYVHSVWKDGSVKNFSWVTAAFEIAYNGTTQTLRLHATNVVVEASLVTLPDGAANVARVGDVVKDLTIPLMFPQPPIKRTFIGSPDPVLLAALLAAGLSGGETAVDAVLAAASINGNPKVKA